MAVMPPFDAVHTAKQLPPKSAISVMIEPVAMTRPEPSSIIRGSTAWQTLK